MWSALGSKLGLCNERLMTNCLSHGTFKTNTTIITTKKNNSKCVVVVVETITYVIIKV
jgi:hypothetical protein